MDKESESISQKPKRTSNNEIDMLHGPLTGKILAMAIPIALSSILQQLFNSVDVAVVGRFASSQAQAAVGCNGPVINLFLNLFVGISVGANVIAANYIGQKKQDKIKETVHTAMTIALISGALLLVLGQVLARPILEWMDTPEDVLEHAILYLKIYFLGMPFIMVYNFGAAILRSVGDTKRPLRCLLISGVINAVLNMILVIVFHMGVAGVAIATMVSNIISSSMVWYFLSHEKGIIHLSVKDLGITAYEMKKILRVGVPAGLQTAIFSFSNVCIQSALNGYGSDAVAGSAITLNYEFFTYFILGAFNQTVITFTSQNFGAGKYDRCKEVYRKCLFFGVVFTFMMSMTFLLGHKFFIGLFTTEPNVAAYAKTRMNYLLTYNCIAGSYEISGAALRGIGYSMTPALLTVFGVCVLRLLWVYLVCPRVPGFSVLMSVYPISWVITGIMVVAVYLVIRKKVFSRSMARRNDLIL
ncbi:MAG: MATE family efflux transporter [Eubacteriales bacterium]|nr:MATE family efflux transporter [Eubacteriales bacterium]